MRLMYFMFVFNMIPDCLRGMLKGPIKGLGLQNEVTKYHIVMQGFVTPLLLVTFLT